MIGNFHATLKFNRFIYNYLPVLPDHWFKTTFFGHMLGKKTITFNFWCKEAQRLYELVFKETGPWKLDHRKGHLPWSNFMVHGVSKPAVRISTGYAQKSPRTLQGKGKVKAKGRRRKVCSWGPRTDGPWSWGGRHLGGRHELLS